MSAVTLVRNKLNKKLGKIINHDIVLSIEAPADISVEDLCKLVDQTIKSSKLTDESYSDLYASDPLFQRTDDIRITHIEPLEIF